MSLEAAFWIAHLPALVGWVALLAGPLIGPASVRIARWSGTILALVYLAVFL
ncbi:MAG: hypothetical protein QOI38_140, partial [Sphingomonadales bacterium]|nr:hypothetical protein [Sphingomonadales bacterium]